MNIDIFTIAMTIINFIILYFILRHFLFTPVNNLLTSRRQDIEGQIKKAQEDQATADRLKAENEELLKEAKQTGRNIVEEYKVKAEGVSEDIIKAANEEAQLLMKRAKNEVDREVEKARDEMKTEAVNLAVLLSSKALEESIDEEKHKKLINDFIAKVGI